MRSDFLLEKETYGKLCVGRKGVAQLRQGEEHMAFFSRAGEALYRAKNSGKNKVVADADK